MYPIAESVHSMPQSVTGVTVIAGRGGAWWIVAVVVEIAALVGWLAWVCWFSPEGRLWQTWRRAQRAAKAQKQQGKALARYNTRQAAKYSPARKAKLLQKLNS